MIGSPDGLIEGLYTIKSVLSVHAQKVFKYFVCLVEVKNKYKVSACFFENTD